MQMKCIRTYGPVRCDYPKDYPCCAFPETYIQEGLSNGAEASATQATADTTQERLRDMW